MPLVKINPEVLHLALHGFVLRADLDNLCVAELSRLDNGLEHLAVQDGRLAGAAVFGDESRAVDVEPIGAVKVRNEYYLPPLVDFDDYTITAYGATSNTNTVTLENDGTTIRIVGDGYEKIEYPYSITQNTILEFDFKSASLGDAHGIGMDIDNGFEKNRIFRLYGSGDGGPFGAKFIKTYSDYENYAPNWHHYVVELGGFFQESMVYLTLGNSAGANPNAESYFANIRKNPSVTIHVGGRRFQSKAEFIPVEQAIEIMETYARDHPVAFSELSGLFLGERMKPGSDAPQRIAEKMPMAAFHPEVRA